ncbi:MAG TPA: hypothetical protein VED63_10000 [Acidimicrobiales bacterium]|nr:hypothetical protein [Acidimicrobiales bacterium]
MSSELGDALALGSGATDITFSPAPLGIRELQRVLGCYQWVERRVFEVLGSWVATEPVAEARVLFDVQSQQHGWHAELFIERMPVVDGVDPAMYVVPPSAEVDQLLATLGGGAMSTSQADVHAAAGAPAGGTLVRLVGLARVLLPRLVTGYGLHLQHCAPVTDAPLVRALRMVVRDDVEAWQATEAMVQSLVRRPHDVAVVTAHQEALEAKVAGAGPGFVSWPGSESF